MAQKPMLRGEVGCACVAREVAGGSRNGGGGKLGRLANGQRGEEYLTGNLGGDVKKATEAPAPAKSYAKPANKDSREGTLNWCWPLINENGILNKGKRWTRDTA